MSKCMNPLHPCKDLHNTHKGAAVVPFKPNTQDILLGYERAGQYEDTYNFFAGSIEVKDKGCFVNTAYREFTEESGW